MTTKVKVEIVQQNQPVRVEVLRGDGTLQHFSVLTANGNTVEEYVHSGQTLRVREMTTQEQHDAASWQAMTNDALDTADGPKEGA